MDLKAALADIDAVLKLQPPADVGERLIIAAANRYDACIARYAPASSVWRRQADRYIALKSYGTTGDPGQDEALYGVLTALREDSQTTG